MHLTLAPRFSFLQKIFHPEVLLLHLLCHMLESADFHIKMEILKLRGPLSYSNVFQKSGEAECALLIMFPQKEYLET